VSDHDPYSDRQSRGLLAAATSELKGHASLDAFTYLPEKNLKVPAPPAICPGLEVARRMQSSGVPKEKVIVEPWAPG